MKLFYFIVFCFPLLARAEEPQAPIWLLVGPEAYRSSVFRDSGWNGRPNLELQIGIGERVNVGGFVNYYQFPYLDDQITHVSYGSILTYDLIPQRLRLGIRAFLTYTDFKNFDHSYTVGAGVKAEYFIPLGNPWRMFFSLGWDLVAKAPMRRDTSANAIHNSCVLFCYGKGTEEKNHIYEYVTVPGSHEFSGSVGAAYAFH